jgi:hypothetical protein
MSLSEYEQRIFTEIEADLTAASAGHKLRLRGVLIACASVALVVAAGLLIWLAVATVLPRGGGVAVAVVVGVCIGAVGSLAWSRARIASRRRAHIVRWRHRPPHDSA